MSTKINVRSPFYVGYSEPVAPTPLFTKATANLRLFSVDAFGALSLPDLDFGVIVDITSDDSDFSNDSFPVVTTETLRNVIFHVEVPAGFSNEGDVVQIEASATQPVFSASLCNPIINSTGTIPTQNLDSGGNSTTLDMSSFFTGTGTIDLYEATNLDPTALDVSITQAGSITITSKNKAGTFSVNVTARVTSTICGTRRPVNVVVTHNTTYVESDINPRGGAIAKDGTITNPSVNGTISAIRLTASGTPITSHSANTTGSPRDVELFFDVTVPDGFANAGATVQTSVTFTQQSQAVDPVFDVDDVAFDDQAILSTGQVVGGTATIDLEGTETPVTIQSFTPTSFLTVASTISRDVTFTVVIPTGFQNAGTTTTKVITLDQPPTNIFELQSCTGATTKIFIGYLPDFTSNPYAAGLGQYTVSRSGSTGYNKVFEFSDRRRAHYAAFPAFIAVSNIFQLQGQHICISGQPIPTANNYGFLRTSISSFNSRQTTVDQDPIEYFIEMDYSRTVTKLYRKDWNTSTIEKIF